MWISHNLAHVLTHMRAGALLPKINMAAMILIQNFRTIIPHACTGFCEMCVFEMYKVMSK